MGESHASRKPTPKDLLLSTISFAEPEDGPEDKLNEVAVCLFTPLGSSALSYTSLDQWNVFKNGGRVPYASSDAKITPTSLAWATHDISKAFNARLHASLRSKEPLARALIRPAFGKQASTSTPTWCHILLQFLLMDKLISMLGPPQEKPSFRQRPVLARPEPETSVAVANLMKLYYEWDVTVGNFIRDWRKEALLDGVPSEYRFTSSEILGTLYHAITETFGVINIKMVEQHFCNAALGLIALVLVSGDSLG